MNKFLKLILFALFFVLFILSIVYYKERVFYYDSAFQFFKIIFNGSFNIEASRYSTCIIQIPTLIALKLGFSLKTLSIVFSASFVAFYFCVFLLITKVLKNNFAGMVLAISLATSTSLGFFHIVTEIHQAIVYVVLFFAWLYFPSKSLSAKAQTIKFTIAFLISILAFFSHPTAIFLLAFVMGFYIIDQKIWKKTEIYLFAIFLFIMALLKAIFTKSDSYEGHLISQFNLFIDLTPKFWTLYSFKFFIKNITGIYLFMVATGFVVAINYIYLKNWLKLGYFLITSILFFLLTIIIYNEGNADIAMERVFLPLNVFVAIPFCKDFLFKKHQKLPVKIYLSVLFIFSLGLIIKGGIKYSKRTQYVKSIIERVEKYDGSKFFVYRSQLNMELIEIPWALSTESLLLSSVDGSSKTFYFVETLDDIAKIKNQVKDVLLITNFWLYWNATDLNKRYFNLSPGYYGVLDENL
jgi:hypothetical protein